MKRRDFITLIGGAAAGWPIAARAQQRKDAPTVGCCTQKAYEHHSDRICSRTRPNRLWTCRKSGPAGRQCNRPVADVDRFEWEAFRVIEGSYPEPIACCASGRSNLHGQERTIRVNQTAAEALGISLWSAEISAPDEIEPVFFKIAQDRADAVMRVSGSMLFNERARVGAAALAHRLAGMTYIGEEVPHGFLMSYGQNFPDFFRRAATYTDRILKGAKPADLPVEQPTKLKLVLNLKTAKSLSISFPQTLILSADEVIE